MSVLAILPHFYTRVHPRAYAVLTPLLVLAVPLGDLAWVVILRTRPPFPRGGHQPSVPPPDPRRFSRERAAGDMAFLAAGDFGFLLDWLISPRSR